MARLFDNYSETLTTTIKVIVIVCSNQLFVWPISHSHFSSAMHVLWHVTFNTNCQGSQLLTEVFITEADVEPMRKTKEVDTRTK